MIWEIIVAGVVLYLIFGSLINAKTEELHERTRMLDLQSEILEDQLHNAGHELPEEGG